MIECSFFTACLLLSNWLLFDAFQGKTYIALTGITGIQTSDMLWRDAEIDFCTLLLLVLLLLYYYCYSQATSIDAAQFLTECHFLLVQVLLWTTIMLKAQLLLEASHI